MTHPSRIAELDQVTAGLNVHVDTLVEAARHLVDKNGPEQGGADLCALLGTWPATDVAALAAIAFVRLAERPSQ